MRLGKAAAIVGIVGCLAAPAAWAANNVSVQAAAASAGTNFGLRVVLESGQTNAAYVMAGPANGFSNEDNLRGSFYVKALGVNFPAAVGSQTYFQMVDFLQGFGASSNVKLIFFLHQDASAPNNIFLTVWHWNDTLAGGAGNWQFSGNGFIASRAFPFSFAQNRIDFEWTAGNPGTIKAWSTNIDGSGAVGATTLIIDRPLNGQSTARINYVFAGHFAAKHAATNGNLDLDEFSFSR